MQTIEEKKEYQKKYREKNKKKINAKRKVYRKNNKEKIKLHNKRYGEKNRKKISIKNKIYNEKNREKISAQKKIYNEKNKEKIRTQKNIYEKNRRKTDFKFKLNNNMSCLIRYSLKNGNGKNGYHWEDLVPYTIDDLIKRLKKTLPKNYMWKDYINGRTNLQIDHKIPVAVHNFKSYTDTDFQRCWALKNLQLLPALENMVKGTKLEKPFQPSLLL